MTMDDLGMTPEQEVIDLLGKLRSAGPEYPLELRTQRRAAVLASLAVVPVAATGLLAISWVARLVKLIKGMALIDQIILGVEVAAVTGLTAYGAVNAYIYRDVIRQLVAPSSNTPFPTLSVPSPFNHGGTSGAINGTQVGTGTPVGTPTPLGTWTAYPPLPNTNQPPASTAVVLPTNPPPTDEPPATPWHGTKKGWLKTKTPKAETPNPP